MCRYAGAGHARVLGRYANVAYEMGGALPPLLQPHSPGQKGLKEGNKLFFCVIYPPRATTTASIARPTGSPSAAATSAVSSTRCSYMANRLSNLFVLNERVALLAAGATASSACRSPWVRPMWARSASTLTRRCAPMCACSATGGYVLRGVVLGRRASCLRPTAGRAVMRWVLPARIDHRACLRGAERSCFDLKPDQKTWSVSALGDIRPPSREEEDQDKKNGRQV